MSWYVPQVFDRTGQSERIYDLYSRLLKDRIIFLQSEINDPIANTVVSQLLFLEADDQDKDIFLYINSPGGSVTAGLAIYDTMQYISSDIQTICIGQAGSMAAVILAAGTAGKRFSLPNSRIIIHQALGGATGQATDIEIQANEMIRIGKVVNDILVTHTNQSRDKIAADIDRDFFMTSEQAKNYGIIDEVFKRKKTTS